MKIIILGGGESGLGAAVLAKKKGLEVFLSDRGVIKEHYPQVQVVAGAATAGVPPPAWGVKAESWGQLPFCVPDPPKAACL